MIFVSVGTNNRFDPLIRAIDEIAPKIKERIIVQIGRSKYEPKNCEYFRFNPIITPYLKKASLVIAHGGAGTTFEVLNMGKKLISVDNPNAIDNHQPDLLRKLSEEGYVLWCRDLDRLYKTVKKSGRFRFRKYKAPVCEINKVMGAFLEGKNDL